MKRQHIYFATCLTLATLCAKAQVKIGSNPTSVTATANLQVESADGTQLFVGKSDGRVGIGTLTPRTKLEVIGSIIVPNNNGYWGTLSNGTSAVPMVSINGNNLVVGATQLTGSLDFWTSGGKAATILGNGNVGIGTSTPQDQLSLYGGLASNTRISIDADAGNQSSIFFRGSNLIKWTLGRQAISSDFIMYNTTRNSTDLTVLESNGNVGIGTTTPAHKLQVAGNITVSGAGVSAWSPVLGIVRDGSSESAYFQLTNNNDFYIKNTNATGGYEFGTVNPVYIATDGKIGIGTKAPTQMLQVQGNILASGTVTPSDVRYKENIASLTGALAKLSQVRGVSYTHKAEFIKERGLKEGNQIGFIAQELEKIFPEFVVTSSDGYKAVDYSRLTPVLVESLKEVNTKLEAQQAEINELKAAVKQLMEKK